MPARGWMRLTRTGEMRHRVDLVHRTVTSDGRGGSTMSYQDSNSAYARKVPAKIRTVDATTRLMVGTVERHEVTHLVNIRHRAGVVSTDRILFKDRTLEVLGITDIDERGRELRLLCKERRE